MSDQKSAIIDANDRTDWGVALGSESAPRTRQLTSLLAWSLSLYGALSCTDGEPPPHGPGVDLTLSEATLERGGNSLSASVPLLRGSVTLNALAGDDAELTVRASTGLLAEGTATLNVPLPLRVGDNTFRVEVTLGTITTHLELNVTRRSAPFTAVELLRGEPPVEDGYFGDYLRASDDTLYVNHQRRGQMYIYDEQWRLAHAADQLVADSLEWMFEAALSSEVLAFVAQPVGGAESLFIFTRGEGRAWQQQLVHPVGTQGTVRIQHRRVFFVSEDGIAIFKEADGAWALAQQLAAPEGASGFGQRPTYFDAPGVSLAEDRLIVAAPEADVALTPEPHWVASCDSVSTDTRCARRAGAVFCYEPVGEGYELVQTLVAEQPAERELFGQAASSNGRWLAVGQRGADPAGPDCGAECTPEAGRVLLFHRTPGTQFAPVGQLTAPTLVAYDYFGDSVLFDSDVLLVGAPGFDTAHLGQDAGAIFAFIEEDHGFRDLGAFPLPPGTELAYPFPQRMHISRANILVAANGATATVDGVELPNAGLVYHLR